MLDVAAMMAAVGGMHAKYMKLMKRWGLTLLGKCIKAQRKNAETQVVQSLTPIIYIYQVVSCTEKLTLRKTKIAYKK